MELYTSAFNEIHIEMHRGIRLVERLVHAVDTLERKLRSKTNPIHATFYNTFQPTMNYEELVKKVKALGEDADVSFLLIHCFAFHFGK